MIQKGKKKHFERVLKMTTTRTEYEKRDEDVKITMTAVRTGSSVEVAEKLADPSRKDCAC